MVDEFFVGIGLGEQDGYVIHCDNQSAIDLSKYVTYHTRIKYIDIRYHWI